MPSPARTVIPNLRHQVSAEPSPHHVDTRGHAVGHMLSKRLPVRPSGRVSVPAEWWALRVDPRCLRAAVDRGDDLLAFIVR